MISAELLALVKILCTRVLATFSSMTIRLLWGKLQEQPSLPSNIITGTITGPTWLPQPTGSCEYMPSTLYEICLLCILRLWWLQFQWNIPPSVALRGPKLGLYGRHSGLSLRICLFCHYPRAHKGLLKFSRLGVCVAILFMELAILSHIVQL